ncbi:MAG: ABC transporter permease [Fimbriimonadaceae bacterium]|nr:ABC transporter permease [Fimbriimonadaceae bacterium]
MREELRELWRFRELLFSMVERELRVRYKNSALGFLWSLIIPAVTTAVLTFVYGYLAKVGGDNFSAYILAAYLPFLFFQQSILDSAQSVLGYLPLVRKIYFPREVLPLGVIIANFIHLVLGWLVFFGYLLFIYIRHPQMNPFQWSTVQLPLLMLISLMLSTGFGLMVSALNTFYEDVKYATSVLLYLLFFLSPITYTSETVAYSSLNQSSGGLLFKLYHLNPIAALSTGYRQALLAPQGLTVNGVPQAPIIMDNAYLYWAAAFSFGTLVFGYHLFNRMKWRFVERP